MNRVLMGIAAFALILFTSIESFAVITVSNAMDPENPQVKHISEMISQESAIRLIVSQGPGMGHQRATLALMTRLHCLGFRGKYHLFGNVWAYENLRTLLNSSPLFPEEKLEFEFAPNFSDEIEALRNLKQMNLGMFAALDFENDDPFETKHVDHLIVMQPTDWPEFSYVEIANQRKDLTCPTVFWDLETHPDLSGILEAALESGPKKDSLRKVVDTMKSGQMDAQVVYGLYEWYTLTQSGLNAQDEMKIIVGGLKQIQNNLQKPLVLLVLSPVDWNILDGLNNLDPKIKALKADSPNTREELSTLRAGDIRVIQVGSLPQPLFDSLLETTTLPPIIEGANARTVVKATRGSYMHGGRLYTCVDDARERPAQAFERQHEIFLKSQKALCTSIDDPEAPKIDLREKSVGEFYKAYLNHEMDEYFAEWHRAFLERPDALLTAISEIEELCRLATKPQLEPMSL